MYTAEKNGIKTLAVDSDPDFFSDLSEYMEVLGHPQRLRILKAIEKEPKDIRSIAMEIGANYENTKKHLYRLLSTSLVRKEAGFSQPTSKGVCPVWKYSLAPGAMDMIIRNLGVFSTVSGAISDATVQKRLEDLRNEIARTLSGTSAALVVVSGSQDGTIFALTGDRMAIGREEPNRIPALEPELILSSDYSSVTRISHPHAIVYRDGNQWYLEDCGSSGGTTVNGTVLRTRQPMSIRSGDVIELGKGPHTALITLVTLQGV